MADPNTQLFRAVKQGQLGGVLDALLLPGIDPESIGSELRIASARGNVDIVKVLLIAGAKTERKDEEGATALHHACDGGKLEVAKVLMQKGADCNATDKIGCTPLHCACCGDEPLEQERLELVTRIIDGGADVKARTDDGDTPLHIACRRNGNSDIVQLLLEKGADSNTQDDQGNTPLHFCSNYEIARLLLESGADLDATNLDGDTPLHLACSPYHARFLTLVQELIRRGANVFAKNQRGQTPFDRCPNAAGLAAHVAPIRNHLLQVYKEKLIETDASLCLHALLQEATTSDNGKQVVVPLGTLGVDQLLALLALLLSQDPNYIRAQDGNRALPLHVACGNSGMPKEVIRFLAEQDAVTLQVQDSTGSLPIHHACRSGGASLPTIKMLVERGGVGTLTARDAHCALPLHSLCESRHAALKVVEYLIAEYPQSLRQKTSTGALPYMLACGASAPEEVLLVLLKGYPEALDYMKAYYKV